MGVINRIHRLGTRILGSFFLREFIPKIRAYILQSRRNAAQARGIYARLHIASRCEVVSSVPITLWRWTSRIAVSPAASQSAPSTSNNRRKSLISERDAENKRQNAKIFAKTRLKIYHVRRIKSEIIEKNPSRFLLQITLRERINFYMIYIRE